MANAIVTTASNHAHYDAAMNDARLLGGNFKTLRNRKRALAVNLIRAAHVEDFALEPLISDTKSKMSWLKLADDERNQMGVFFNALRVISGAWPKLPDDVKASFLAGEKVFSTLAKEIKDAEKAEAEAEAKREADEAAAEAARNAPEAPATAAAQAAPTDPAVAAMRLAALFVDETPLAKMTPDQLVALKNLADAIDEFRANAAKPAQITLAA
jgi:hypothetical protein